MRSHVRRLISYRVSMVVAIPLLVAAAGALIVWSSYGRTRRQIDQSTEHLFAEVSRQAGQEARGHLLRAVPIADLARRLLDADAATGSAPGAAPATIDRRALATRFVAFLRANPDLSWVSYSGEDGSFTGAFHSAGGAYRANLSEIVSGKTVLHEYDVDETGAWTLHRHDPDSGYDPRTRPFYAKARARGGRVWTEPYVFFEQGVPGITFAMPHTGADGKLRGVFSVDFDLNSLSRFVAAQRLGGSDRGRVFIYADRVVLAHPSLRLVEQSGAGAEGKLVSVDDVADPVVKAFAGVELGGAAAATSGDAGRFFRVQVDGQPWYARATRIEIDEGLSWIVGAAAPEADFDGGLRAQLRDMVLFGAVLVAISVLLSVAFAFGVSRPLTALSSDLAEIGQFNLEDRPRRSVFREIQDMNDAVAGMKGSLRSFARYVPRDLVRSVLASGQEAVLAGKTKELTVFFSDIAGFTTIAEGLTPEQLVELLGGYLDEMTRVISEHQGTVDKFLGDGVMAFWGAPRGDETHAVHACQAALRARRRLANRDLVTRIGIATGPVVVGNIGSHERMNYTVMGDTANLAARLEGLNKQYDTSIMISESTWRAAREHIVARPIDLVAVKGKAQAVRVYELLALAEDHDAAAEELARRSTEALDGYLARRFTDAARELEAILALRPDDAAARRFLERCRAYAATPPGADWTGVFQATEK